MTGAVLSGATLALSPPGRGLGEGAAVADRKPAKNH